MAMLHEIKMAIKETIIFRPDSEKLDALCDGVLLGIWKSDIGCSDEELQEAVEELAIDIRQSMLGSKSGSKIDAIEDALQEKMNGFSIEEKVSALSNGWTIGAWFSEMSEFCHWDILAAVERLSLKYNKRQAKVN